LIINLEMEGDYKMIGSRLLEKNSLYATGSHKTQNKYLRIKK